MPSFMKLTMPKGWRSVEGPGSFRSKWGQRRPKGDCEAGWGWGASRMQRAVREGRVGTGDPWHGGEPWADAVTAGTAGKQGVGGAGEDHIACGCQPPPCPPAGLPAGTGGSGTVPGTRPDGHAGGLLTAEKQAWVPPKERCFYGFSTHLP